MKITNVKVKFINFFKNSGLVVFAMVYAILGALSGSANSSKIFRRVLIPVFTMLFAYLVLLFQIGWLKSLWVISIMSMIGILSVGYGIPDDGYETNPNLDKGSAIGNLMYRIFNKNRVLADVFTRGIVGLGLSISLLSVPILSGKWLYYFIGCGIILIGQMVFSWQALGEYKFTFKNKPINLLYSDLLNYTCLGLGVYLIIVAKLF